MNRVVFRAVSYTVIGFQCQPSRGFLLACQPIRTVPPSLTRQAPGSVASSQTTNDGLDRRWRDPGRLGDLGHCVPGCPAHVADSGVSLLPQVFERLAGFSDALAKFAQVFKGRHDSGVYRLAGYRNYG